MRPIKEVETLEENANSNKVRVGTKLVRQLSTTFYPNIRMIFDELIVNARDALATNVAIQVHDDKIVIEDNGEGMTRDQLVKFFYISYTEKTPGEVKVKGKIKRATIGKFGVGKLSLYRLCRSFDIVTWRDNKAWKASFDFDSFERNDFIDEFELKVEEEEIVPSDSGTGITLKGLKEPLNLSKIKRELQKTMPMTPNFKVTLVGDGLFKPIEITSESVIAGKADDIYEIEENNRDIGLIRGKIAYFPTGTIDSGIYIRVFERLVNLENAKNIIDFTDLSHAYDFDRKVIAEFNVDGLSDALQTNRSGFIIDHPKYTAFKTWLEKTIRSSNDEQFKKKQKQTKRIEAEVIPQRTSEIIQSSLLTSEPIATHIKKKEISLKKEPSKPKITKSFKNVSIVSQSLGEDRPESFFDDKNKEIVINSDHPLYVVARANGKLWGTLYHSLKASIVRLAIEMSKSLEEFEKNYEDLSRNSEAKFKEIKRIRKD